MDDYETGSDENDLAYQNQLYKNKNADLANALSSGAFNEPDEQNLIQYQLETDKILERIEHFLKGDQVNFGESGAYYSSPTKEILTLEKEDQESKIKYYIQESNELKKGSEIVKNILVKIVYENGEEIDIRHVDSKSILSNLDNQKIIDKGYKYILIPDEDKKPFNEYGVAELMRIMSMYLTKETFLSYYEEERINEILGDLGDALNNFLYCNYEKMGMDTKFKESKYTIICLNLLHTVESCYRRALRGAEQTNIRTRAVVTQNQGLGGGGHRPMKKKWSPFDKKTW